VPFQHRGMKPPEQSPLSEFVGKIAVVILCGQNVCVYVIESPVLGWVPIRRECFFWELAELRWMQCGTKTKILPKAGYQRPPLLWIDPIRLTNHNKAFMNVYSQHPHFDGYGRKRPIDIVFAKRSNAFDDCFELHRTLFRSRRLDQVGRYGR
jgi:hypothetical protein